MNTHETLTAAHFRGAPHRWLEVGEARLAYRCIGAGPDVLFVHGWPLSSATWRKVANQLCDRFTCHLIDLPGAGQTTGTAPIGMDAHAETLRRALDVLGLERVSLVGQDSGGSTARLMALAEPDRIQALVLGNTEIPHDRSPLIRTLTALGAMPFCASALRLLLRVGWLRRNRHIGFGSSFADPAMVDGEFYTLAVRPLLEDADKMQSAATYLGNFDMGIVDAMAEGHADIRCPTRLIWGARDSTFPLQKAEAMMAQFTAPIDCVTLPTGKLFAHEEFPAAFAAHAAEHLISKRQRLAC